MSSKLSDDIQVLKGRLAKVLPWRSDPLSEYADLLVSGIVEEANARGFVIQSRTGRIQVDLPGGLTKHHYARFAKLVTEEEKGLLARGVLEHITQFDWLDWNAGIDILRKQYGVDEEAWLPNMAESKGFDAIATELRDCLAKYRHTNPRPCLKLGLVGKPTWNMARRILSYGGMRWPFREDAEVIMTLLNELEKNKWEPINFSNPREQGNSSKLYIDPEQVRSAAKALRKKTPTHLNWHAADDGTFSWSLR